MPPKLPVPVVLKPKNKALTNVSALFITRDMELKKEDSLGRT